MYLRLRLADFAAAQLRVTREALLHDGKDPLDANADSHCRDVLPTEHAHQPIVPG